MANTDRSGSPVNQVGAAAAVTGKQTLSTGTRHWTGVWGNAANPAANSSQRRFLNWLVSGNESVPVSALETGAEFGRIQSTEPAGATLPVKATDATSLTLATRPFDNVTIGGRDGRLLVGPRSVGTETADLVNYVVAPLVDIETATAQIPGLGSAAGNTTIGRYAYWVGDEGVKARINLANPWPEATNLADAASERIWSFATAQRTAGERMQGLATLATDPDTVAKLLTPKQVNFAANGTLSSDDLGRRYHDYSLVSRSVLADVRRGGLKRDLTRILQPGGGSADEADDAPLFPHLGSAADPFYARPATWGLLRDFQSYGTVPFGTLQPRAPSATQAGVAPVLLLARLDYTHTVGAPVPSAAPGEPATQTWNAHISPYFILWNPYNRPLQGARYEIGVQGPRKALGTEQRGLVQYKLIMPPPPLGEDPPPDQTLWLNLGAARFEHPDYPRDGIDPALWSAPTTRRDFFRFTAVVPTLQPGQAVFIGINNGTFDYTPGMQLFPRNYLDRLNYSNVARIRTDSLAINAATAAEISIPDTKRFGEVNAYLGIEGVGADPSAATNSGSSDYYQWIGRVEISTPFSQADDYGPTNQTITNGSTGFPFGVASFQLWHQLGVSNINYTAPSNPAGSPPPTPAPTWSTAPAWNTAATTPSS